MSRKIQIFTALFGATLFFFSSTGFAAGDSLDFDRLASASYESSFDSSLYDSDSDLFRDLNYAPGESSYASSVEGSEVVVATSAKAEAKETGNVMLGIFAGVLMAGVGLTSAGLFFSHTRSVTRYRR